VSNAEIKTVNEFRYLGLSIVNNSNKPDKLLVDRIQHATRTFNALKSNCRLLGLTNVWVRI
jgi:hypothetical protein